MEAHEVLARGPWTPESVRVTLAGAYVLRYPAMVERAWSRAVEEAERSSRRLFPGPIFGLASFAVQGGLELALQATDYRAFVGTNLSEEFRATGAPCADALGISIVVALEDGKVLLHRRGAACFEHPLAIDTPGGHVEPHHLEGGAPSPFAAARDELESELGVRGPEVSSMSLLALSRIRETRKPQAAILARVGLSFSAVRARLETARERFETSELLEPLRPTELAPLARSAEGVTPAGRAALLVAADVLVRAR